MRTKTKYYKTSPIQADRFKKTVENFCSENMLSACCVSERKAEMVFFLAQQYL
ncbi:hypothetical protein [Desulfosporosinus fructosivorans]|uniref:hypothetical protein n=1 Tax=Desulfosporosinus fructosivorans TaxID=2018669 RepID=UPI00130DDA0F|nr:hypothetical protein [Desulfosporosinus fructosivorans]